jgi:hypothetical protein
MVLTAVVLVPESQLWTLIEPHRSRIERRLAWAADTRSQETKIDTLATLTAMMTGSKRI